MASTEHYMCINLQSLIWGTLPVCCDKFKCFLFLFTFKSLRDMIIHDIPNRTIPHIQDGGGVSSQSYLKKNMGWEICSWHTIYTKSAIPLHINTKLPRSTPSDKWNNLFSCLFSVTGLALWTGCARPPPPQPDILSLLCGRETLLSLTTGNIQQLVSFWGPPS